MEMNFPHHDLHRLTLDRVSDFHALLAQIIARQDKSETARVMLQSNRSVRIARKDEADFLVQRIGYFAASTTLKKQRTSPHGAFFLLNRNKKDVELNYEDAVYQNASVNIKPTKIISELSEVEAVPVGQEN
jgi:hypothetical protein